MILFLMRPLLPLMPNLQCVNERNADYLLAVAYKRELWPCLNEAETSRFGKVEACNQKKGSRHTYVIAYGFVGEAPRGLNHIVRQVHASCRSHPFGVMMGDGRREADELSWCYPTRCTGIPASNHLFGESVCLPHGERKFLQSARPALRSSQTTHGKLGKRTT